MRRGPALHALLIGLLIGGLVIWVLDRHPIRLHPINVVVTDDGPIRVVTPTSGRTVSTPSTPATAVPTVAAVRVLPNAGDTITLPKALGRKQLINEIGVLKVGDFCDVEIQNKVFVITRDANNLMLVQQKTETGRPGTCLAGSIYYLAPPDLNP